MRTPCHARLPSGDVPFSPPSAHRQTGVAVPKRQGFQEVELEIQGTRPTLNATPGRQTHSTLASGQQPGGRTATGPTASYLLSPWALRAGRGGTQPPARQLPCGGHCARADVTLRVSQKLLGELGHL